ncbi:competence type IV pilus minor pilin ComGF [Oceanobacillus rekensis]|uniref:competence type IV pilus minor pilin ComGF n=1 Tax=Oceanobacillus rekensis TaxID=937927 RepID=UPI0015939638|nr:competence type IV pilus minor pilin ComGF [Oceanobacillus rekensis]
MEYRHREQGFTFITVLLTITILSITLPFLSYIIQAADYESNYEEVSVQQFFQFVRDEVIKSTSLQVKGKKLYLNQKYEHVSAKLELYGSLVRRQINGQGHEIYLREVKDISFTSLPFGVRISVTMLSGDKYEKSIVQYY